MIHMTRFTDITKQNEARLKRERILKLSKQADKPEILTGFILAVAVGMVVAAILVSVMAPHVLEAIDNPGYGTLIILISIVALVGGWLIIRSANESKFSEVMNSKEMRYAEGTYDRLKAEMKAIETPELNCDGTVKSARKG
jgi:uncharacterized membrane protein